jgi:hypothetical protein
MRSIALREIFEGISRLDVDEVAKQQFRLLVARIGSEHGVKGVDIDERISFARRLIEARVSRPTVRDRLIARYGISGKQAYRTISAAMELGHKLPPNDTNTKEN